MPLLSIITINFNNAEGLKKTIESVFSQSFNDFEYLIIDGGSTDGSVEIIKQNKKINYWISEKDNGIYDAMNKGILKSFGNYLLFLNSGDYLCENVLGKVFSETHNEDILYGNMKINWGENNITDGIMPNKITLEHLVKDTLWHPVSFIKKELFNKFGLYNTDYEIVADYEFFFKNIIINKSSNVHLNYFITEYNVEGFSSLPSNKAKEKAERLKVIKMYLSDQELKKINYLLVEKNETLFMSVFKRLKKIINLNGYKS
jgi:glycosyltransferase involved in cell wall biosynthesis